jgi:pSer/pThr/pTyr-binding forkhead associated (FHA) protein
MSGIVLLILRVLIAASLYAFFGLALYLLWRDLQGQTRPAALYQPPALTLIRITDEEPVQLRFTSPEIIIGRDPACELVLEDSTVSAKHTRLFFRQGQWWVEDLRSTNGTYLNQEPINSSLVITSGDEIRCGQVALTITVGESL